MRSAHVLCSVLVGAGLLAVACSQQVEPASSSNQSVSTGLVVSTLAGSGVEGFVDGARATAQFRLPTGLTVDRSGNVYVADYLGVRKVDAQGNVTTLAGSVFAGFADGARSQASFTFASDVALDPAGNVLVADTSNRRVRKIDGAGNVTTLAGNGQAGLVDGAPTVAEFLSPAGLALDASGLIYAIDFLSDDDHVRTIDSSGNVATVGGLGIQGIGKQASPHGIAADAAGNLYIPDTQHNRIVELVQGQGVITIAGNGTWGNVDGPGASAEFSEPYAVARDGAGNLFVADAGDNRIRKIDTGGYVTTIAGNGTSGYVDGAAALAEFNLPTGIAVGTDGTIYVADTANLRIRAIRGAASCSGALCGGVCKDTGSDPGNCGACGHVCAAGQLCDAGVCTTPCNGTVCSGVCTNLETDGQNCGACGDACAAGQLCESGVCTTPCHGTVCSGLCTNLQTDTGNCGACGNACAAGQLCESGVCTTPCNGTVCSGLCTNLQTDTGNCGACGTACAAGQLCESGGCRTPCNGTVCSGTCTNVQTDSYNCGACGNACSAGTSCVAGQCTTTCSGATCGGQCVDIWTDPLNCGACGHVCASPQGNLDGIVCSNGQCEDCSGDGAGDCFGCCTPIP